jgi:hypothetical protein
MLARMEHDRWMAARKQAGVPTARNGPPERIPTCDWDAGVSEHAKEKDRMFVRGLLTSLEAEGLAIVRTPECSLGIFYTSWDDGTWR